MAAELHLAEQTFALHLFLQRLEGLVDIVVTDENLHVELLFEAVNRPDSQAARAIGICRPNPQQDSAHTRRERASRSRSSGTRPRQPQQPCPRRPRSRTKLQRSPRIEGGDQGDGLAEALRGASISFYAPARPTYAALASAAAICARPVSASLSYKYPSVRQGFPVSSWTTNPGPENIHSVANGLNGANSAFLHFPNSCRFKESLHGHLVD